MPGYLLDTNHASRLLIPEHPLWDRIHAAVGDGHQVLLPALVLEEIRFGIEIAVEPELQARWLAGLDALLIGLPIAGLPADVAIEGGIIRGQLRRRGRQVGRVDAMLAAMARLHGHVLLTDDRDFAPLAGEIRIENWLR